MAEKETKGFDTKIIALVALAVVLLVGGAFYFGQSGQQTAPPPTPDQMGAPAAKLLLSAFDAGARLQDYSLDYKTIDNGVETAYQLKKNSSASWANVTGDFGNLQGFFGGNESEDIVCLAYGPDRRCAIVHNNSDAKKIAASLKVIFPNKRTYLEQKSQMQKLISAGAIKLDPEIAEETVNGFETKRVSYQLDYQRMTVQQLISAGISPDDPAITTTTDQKVSFSIDKKTGLIVNSVAAYQVNTKKQTYATAYTAAGTKGVVVPEKPGAVVDTGFFVSFYHASEQDYMANGACAAQQGSDRDACYKTLAVEQHSWDVCKKINDKTVYEGCTLIVAQNTNNKVLCGKLELMADDCYIAVVGNTGEYALCKNLKNTSLAPQCTAAATEGAKTAAADAERLRRMRESRNCVLDTDCKTAGNAGQYCTAKNDTRTFAVEDTPMLACFKNLPCACNDGFCGFNKTESYYSCINDAEESTLNAFISSLNATNSTAAGK